MLITIASLNLGENILHISQIYL